MENDSHLESHHGYIWTKVRPKLEKGWYIAPFLLHLFVIKGEDKCRVCKQLSRYWLLSNGIIHHQPHWIEHLLGLMRSCSKTPWSVAQYPTPPFPTSADSGVGMQTAGRFAKGPAPSPWSGEDGVSWYRSRFNFRGDNSPGSCSCSDNLLIGQVQVFSGPRRKRLFPGSCSKSCTSAWVCLLHRGQADANRDTHSRMTWGAIPIIGITGGTYACLCPIGNHSTIPLRKIWGIASVALSRGGTSDPEALGRNNIAPDHLLTAALRMNIPGPGYSLILYWSCSRKFPSLLDHNDNSYEPTDWTLWQY